MDEVILKRFEQPDEIREFEKGKFEIVRIRALTIGRATYQPGWKWSEHVSPLAGTAFCEVEHFGMVISGRSTAAMVGGEVYELGPGPSSTFHQHRTIVGWLGKSRMCRSTFWAQIVTQGLDVLRPRSA
jgi:hypothetical protein